MSPLKAFRVAGSVQFQKLNFIGVRIKTRLVYIGGIPGSWRGREKVDRQELGAVPCEASTRPAIPKMSEAGRVGIPLLITENVRQGVISFGDLP